MWREAILAALVLHLARVPNPDRREESHVGARGGGGGEYAWPNPGGGGGGGGNQVIYHLCHRV